MFGYGMSPWSGEGFSQRPLHPGPGLSPQPSSTRFVGGLMALSLPCDVWPMVSCQELLFPEAQQGRPGRAWTTAKGPMGLQDI